MTSITIRNLDDSSATPENLKTRLLDLAALAPDLQDGASRDARSVEDELRFINLSAAMRYELSAARAAAGLRVSKRLSATKPPSRRQAEVSACCQK